MSAVLAWCPRAARWTRHVHTSLSFLRTISFSRYNFLFFRQLPRTAALLAMRGVVTFAATVVVERDLAAVTANLEVARQKRQELLIVGVGQKRVHLGHPRGAVKVGSFQRQPFHSALQRLDGKAEQPNRYRFRGDKLELLCQRDQRGLEHAGLKQEDQRDERTGKRVSSTNGNAAIFFCQSSRPLKRLAPQNIAQNSGAKGSRGRAFNLKMQR